MVKKLFKILSVLVTIFIILCFINYVNIFHFRTQVSAQVTNFCIVNNPQEITEISNVLNERVDDHIEDDTFNLKSVDTNENLTFNLKDYNVYQVNLKFINNSKLPIAFCPISFGDLVNCLLVPTTFTYESLGNNASSEYMYYFFISKSYSCSQIEDSLKSDEIVFSTVFIRERTAGDFNIHAKLL